MFQCQSIINALNRKNEKNTKDWIRNQQTKEFLEGFLIEGEFSCMEKLYEKRQNLNIVLRGYYINELLVNFFASWVSSRYAYKISLLLRAFFNKQREELENRIKASEEEIKILQPRLVPKNKEKAYHYMIYMEKTDNDASVELHLVRRNHRSFHKTFKDIQKSDKCLYFKDKLPIAMTPNEDIKKLIANNFSMSEYIINSSSIIIYKKHLDKVKDLIINYFEMMQEK